MRRLLPFIALLAVLQALAFADIGPKPGMDFAIVYETSQPVTLVAWELFECSDASCSSPKPLVQVGPQHFTCRPETNSCSSLAYSYARYQKLVLNFSDRARESNVFESGAALGEYIVTVRDADLVVTPAGGTSGIGLLAFIIALFLTLIIEMPAAILFVFIGKIPRKWTVLVGALVGNLFSVPAVWFVFQPSRGLAELAVAEFFALVLEAVFIYAVAKGLAALMAGKPSRKKPAGVISLKQAALLSLLMNAASVIAGFLLIVLFSA
jgi:hypothetical protein